MSAGASRPRPFIAVTCAAIALALAWWIFANHESVRGVVPLIAAPFPIGFGLAALLLGSRRARGWPSRAAGLVAILGGLLAAAWALWMFVAILLVAEG